MNVNNPHSIENFLTSGSRGYFPLWTAIWRYYLLGRIVALSIAILLVFTLGFFGWFLAFIIWIPYWIWSLVTLWQCAPNSPWPLSGPLVRTWVYLEVVLAVFNIDHLTLTAL
jgi:hypothetical protein